MAVFIGFIVYKAVLNNQMDTVTVTADFRDIEKTLTIPGIVQPSKEIDIKSTISGVLDELFVQIGDDVIAGQPLARVQFVKDPLEYRRMLKDLDVAKKRLENTEKTFKRTKTLFEKKMIAPEEYENEQSNLAVIQTEYQAIESELNMLKGYYNLEEVSNIITATNQGTILELPVKEGGSVMARGTLNEGTTIARIADLKSLVFKGNILESDVVQIKPDMPVKLITGISEDVEIDGSITLIAPKGVVQDGVARFEITANLLIPEMYRPLIRAGCTANATFTLKKKTHVLALEEKYFSFAYDSIYVEVKNEKGKFEKRFLKIGISDGIYTEILEGLDSSTVIKTRY